MGIKGRFGALCCGLFIVGMLPACSSGSENGSSAERSSAEVVESLDVAIDSSAAVGDAEGMMDSSEKDRPPVDEAGPHQVGYRTISLEYFPEEGRSRVLDLHFWYPTAETEGENPMYEKVFPDEVSLVGAELLSERPDEGFPVLIFSHGHRGFAGNAAFLMRHFASHGWAAVAPDHTNNTLTDGGEPREMALQYLRAMDMKALLDFLAEDGGTDPLHGNVAVERVVMAGHSVGVNTGWAIAGASFDMEKINQHCAQEPEEDGCHAAGVKIFEDGLADERVVSMIAMAGSIDGNIYGPDGHSTVTIPIFAMSGTEDPVGADGQFERCEEMDFRWIELNGGCHQTFGFGGCATLDDKVGFNLVSSYALAFARHTLMLDNTEEVLGYVNGGSIPSDKITFHGAP